MCPWILITIFQIELKSKSKATPVRLRWSCLEYSNVNVMISHISEKKKKKNIFALHLVLKGNISLWQLLVWIYSLEERNELASSASTKNKIRLKTQFMYVDGQQSRSLELLCHQKHRKYVMLSESSVVLPDLCFDPEEKEDNSKHNGNRGAFPNQCFKIETYEQIGRLHHVNKIQICERDNSN